MCGLRGSGRWGLHMTGATSLNEQGYLWRCLPGERKAHAFFGGPKSLCGSALHAQTDRTVDPEESGWCASCAVAIKYAEYDWNPLREDNWRVCSLCEGWLPEYEAPGIGYPCACRGLDDYLERMAEEAPADFEEFGPGIAEEQAQQRAVFSRFYLAEGPTNRLCHGIAGGSVWKTKIR